MEIHEKILSNHTKTQGHISITSKHSDKTVVYLEGHAKKIKRRNQRIFTERERESSFQHYNSDKQQRTLFNPFFSLLHQGVFFWILALVFCCVTSAK